MHTTLILGLAVLWLGANVSPSNALPIPGAVLSRIRSQQVQYAVVDVVLANPQGTDNKALAPYTGVREKVITKPYVPGVVGDRITAMDLYENDDELLPAGVFVRYAKVEGGKQEVVADIEARRVSAGGCRPGYKQVEVVPFDKAGVPDKHERVLCVHKVPVSELVETAVPYVLHLTLTSSACGKVAWVPGDRWVRDAVPLHGSCPTPATFGRETLLAFEYEAPAGSQVPSNFSPKEKRTLIEAHAPLVWLHKDERFFPSSVSFAFENTHRELRNGHWSLTTNDKLANDSDDSLPFFGGQGRGSGQGQDLKKVPVYAQWFNRGENVADIAYWFFYPFNYGKRVSLLRRVFGNHVGDWEHITVRLVDGRATEMYTAIHDFGLVFNWAKGTLKTPEGRPIVYSAQGSHGTWTAAGRMPFVNLGVANLADDTDAGFKWPTHLAVEAFDFDTAGGKAAAGRALPGNKEFPDSKAPPPWMRKDSGNPKEGNRMADSGPLYRWGNRGHEALMPKFRVLSDGPTGPIDKAPMQNAEFRPKA